MKIVSFEGVNSKLPNGADCHVSQHEGMKMIITAWLPSKKDIEEMRAGKPIYLQVCKEMYPTIIYTVGKDGKPNLEQEQVIGDDEKSSSRTKDISGFSRGYMEPAFC